MLKYKDLDTSNRGYWQNEEDKGEGEKKIGRMCEKCEMCKNVKEGKRKRKSIKWDKKNLGWDREVV